MVHSPDPSRLSRRFMLVLVGASSRQDIPAEEGILPISVAPEWLRNWAGAGADPNILTNPGLKQCSLWCLGNNRSNHLGAKGMDGEIRRLRGTNAVGVRFGNLARISQRSVTRALLEVRLSS